MITYISFLLSKLHEAADVPADVEVPTTCHGLWVHWPLAAVEVEAEVSCLRPRLTELWQLTPPTEWAGSAVCTCGSGWDLCPKLCVYHPRRKPGTKCETSVHPIWLGMATTCHGLWVRGPVLSEVLCSRCTPWHHTIALQPPRRSNRDPSNSFATCPA